MDGFDVDRSVFDKFIVILFLFTQKNHVLDRVSFVVFEDHGN